MLVDEDGMEEWRISVETIKNGEIAATLDERTTG
jgi:hypothetical protein